MVPADWADENERLEAEVGIGDMVSAKEKHRRWRDGPVVIGIKDVVADVLRFVAESETVAGSGNGFMQQLQHTNDGAAHGDESMDAYMTLT